MALQWPDVGGVGSGYGGGMCASGGERAVRREKRVGRGIDKAGRTKGRSRGGVWDRTFIFLTWQPSKRQISCD